jgi:NADH:ubiquinone oxidoreductase subunit 6 (subunit J)
MVNPQIIAYIVLAVLCIYQLWVTVLVYRADEYDSKQRNLQCLAIWLIPFLAALTCHLVLRSSRAPIKPSKTSIVDQADNVGAENIGIGSATD